MSNSIKELLDLFKAGSVSLPLSPGVQKLLSESGVATPVSLKRKVNISNVKSLADASHDLSTMLKELEKVAAKVVEKAPDPEPETTSKPVAFVPSAPAPEPVPATTSSSSFGSQEKSRKRRSTKK